MTESKEDLLRGDWDFVQEAKSGMSKERRDVWAKTYGVSENTVRRIAGSLKADIGDISIFDTEVHPSAHFMPEMTEEDFYSMKESIRTNGCEVSLRAVIRDGKALIWDGRHRRQALLDIAEEYPDTPLPDYKIDVDYFTDAGILNKILLLNVTRRHLTKSQLATIAVQIQDLLLTGETTAHDLGVPDYILERARGATRDIAGFVAKVNGRYVDQARSLRDNHPDIFEQVNSGTKSIKMAKEEVSARIQDEVEERKHASKQPVPCSSWTDLPRHFKDSAVSLAVIPVCDAFVLERALQDIVKEDSEGVLVLVHLNRSLHGIDSVTMNQMEKLAQVFGNEGRAISTLVITNTNATEQFEIGEVVNTWELHWMLYIKPRGEGRMVIPDRAKNVFDYLSLFRPLWYTGKAIIVGDPALASTLADIGMDVVMI